MMLMSCRQFHLTPSRAWHLRGKAFKADATASLSNIRSAIVTENAQKGIRAETCLLTELCTTPGIVMAPEVPEARKKQEKNAPPEAALWLWDSVEIGFNPPYKTPASLV